VDDTLILGRYRPLAVLGEGGHGTVELAFDTRMARRVALKRVPVSHRGFEILSTSTGLAEARIAALLNHPNIVTMYEWDTDDDEAFLIMEYVDGASLSALLARFSPLDRDEAAAVLAPVADALTFAHANGVMHLDLKPDNVLVTRDGLVKVTDFGVASLTNAAGQAISAGGTLGYMPPEQLRGGFVDPRADIWAFGALAVEVMTGSSPFAADDVEEALQLALAGFPPRGSRLGLDADVETVLADALAASPDERSSSMSEVGSALLAHLGHATEGRVRLAGLVEDVAPIEESEDDPVDWEEASGVWRRVAARAPGLGERLVTSAGTGLLAWTGAHALGLGGMAALAAVVIATAAGAAAPSLGLAVGLVLAAAGAFAYSVVVGLVVSVVATGWWLAVGRRRPGVGVFPALAPLLGALGLAPALPLLAGFFVDDVWAAAAAGAAAVLAATLVPARVLASALLPGPALAAATVASLPATLPALGEALLATSAAAVAAALAGLGAGRGTRPGAAAGALGGLAVMAAATGPWLARGGDVSVSGLLPFALALILVGVVIAAGPPVRDAEDDIPGV
jgi:serine/threonine-protein kinase